MPVLVFYYVLRTTREKNPRYVAHRRGFLLLFILKLMFEHQNKNFRSYIVKFKNQPFIPVGIKGWFFTVFCFIHFHDLPFQQFAIVPPNPSDVRRQGPVGCRFDRFVQPIFLDLPNRLTPILFCTRPLVRH